jgi:hypothetical protein
MTSDNPNPILFVNGPVRTRPNSRPNPGSTKRKPRLAKRKTELKCVDYASERGRKLLEEQEKYLMFGHLDREIVRLWQKMDEVLYRLDTIETGRRSR